MGIVLITLLELGSYFRPANPKDPIFIDDLRAKRIFIPLMEILSVEHVWEQQKQSNKLALEFLYFRG